MLFSGSCRRDQYRVERHACGPTSVRDGRPARIPVRMCGSKLVVCGVQPRVGLQTPQPMLIVAASHAPVDVVPVSVPGLVPVSELMLVSVSEPVPASVSVSVPVPEDVDEDVVVVSP